MQFEWFDVGTAGKEQVAKVAERAQQDSRAGKLNLQPNQGTAIKPSRRQEQS